MTREAILSKRLAESQTSNRAKRASMPNVAAIADDVRVRMGFPDARVSWGHDYETGVSTGTRRQGKVTMVSPRPMWWLTKAEIAQRVALGKPTDFTFCVEVI